MMEHFWMKCRRQKFINDEQLYHSESQRRLGLCSLVAIGSVLILSTTLFVILPSAFAVSNLHSPPLASVLLVSLIFRLTASQLQSISRTTPKTALLYNFAYVLNSEVLGFLVAWSQFLDGFSLLSILVQTFSDHINLLFNIDSQNQLRVDFNIANLLTLRVDLIAIIFLWIGAILMCFSLRVLTTISVVFLIACLFTSTSTTVVALLHNLAHLKIKYIEFPYAFNEVFNESFYLLIIVLCLEMLSFTSEETEHPRKILPLVFPALSKATIILLFFAVLAFFPFGYRQAYTLETLLPQTFNTISIYSARYLMSVGSICGLGAGVLIAFLYGSRLMCALANDKLLPSCISTIFGNGGSCRLAVVLTALFVSFWSTVPRQTVCRLLPLNICLRLTCQAILVYKSCFMPEQEELNGVPTYDQILSSNRSSMIGRHSVLDEYSFGSGGSLSDDEDEDLLMNSLWKVNGNECESSFSDMQQVAEKEELLSNKNSTNDSTPKSEVKSTNSSVTIPMVVSKLDAHNCLISSCAESNKKSMQKWPRFHIYESECMEPASVILRRQSRRDDLDSDELHKKAMRYVVYFAFLSTLISICHKIIRETKDFLPVLPLATLIASLLLVSWIFFSIYRLRQKADVQKGRYLPCECLVSIFLLFQFLLNFPLFNYLIESVWLILGFFAYLLLSLKRL